MKAKVICTISILLVMCLAFLSCDFATLTYESATDSTTESIQTKTDTTEDTESETDTETETETETEPENENGNEKEPEKSTTYILNTNSHIFHKEFCSSAKNISAANKQIFTGERAVLIGNGYSACKRCNP